MTEKEVICTGITSKFFEKRKYQSDPVKPLSSENKVNTMKVIRTNSFENIPLAYSKCQLFSQKKKK
jgi:hypothetical protein